MKLRDKLPTDKNMSIRIFCGPQTIFHGERSGVPDKEWNLKVGPYMDCEVVNADIINGRMTFMI